MKMYSEQACCKNEVDILLPEKGFEWVGRDWRSSAANYPRIRFRIDVDKVAYSFADLFCFYGVLSSLRVTLAPDHLVCYIRSFTPYTTHSCPGLSIIRYRCKC